MKRRELTAEEKADADRLRMIWNKEKTRLNLSQEEMAHLCGWKTQGAFSQYLLGKIPLNLETVLSISKILEIDPAEISPHLAGKITLARAGAFRVGEPLVSYSAPRASLEPIAEWDNPNDLPAGGYALVPRYRVSISDTDGHLLTAPDSAPPLIFPTLWIKRQELRRCNLVVFEVCDDRMQPRIYPGDTLLIDRGQTGRQDRKPYLLRYGCELRVQQLARRYDGALILQSLNPAYADEIIPVDALNDQIEIVGRVIWASVEL